MYSKRIKRFEHLCVQIDFNQKRDLYTHEIKLNELTTKYGVKYILVKSTPKSICVNNN